MLLPDNWLFETIKLLCQLGGALLVAWLAVGWALKRYKREKTWEKRLQAFTEILVATGEMHAVARLWKFEDEDEYPYSKQFRKDLDDRYTTARLKVEEVSAMSMLILPEETTDTLKSIEECIAEIPRDFTQQENYSEVERILSEKMKELVAQGRRALGAFE